MEFDEHLLRQAFYKSLHPPYLTNSRGNSRSDALRMVQAASLFAPGALAFPTGEDGKVIFKLDRVAPLNGFAHQYAHDAVADVEATIFLCRKLIERTPELWSSFMRFSQKAAVADHINSEAIFSLSDFYFGKPYSWLVTVIGSNQENSSEFYVYNLSIDPVILVGLTGDDLIERLSLLPKPVRRLRSNACPIIMPMEDAPTIATAVQVGIEQLTRRAEFLREHEEFRTRLIEAFKSTREEPTESPHLERQLYDSFFPTEDEPLIERFHAVPWEERPAIVDAFRDRRLRKIGQRLIYLERPDLLADTDRAQYDRAVAIRIGKDDAETPWLTLPRALADLDELIAEADPIELPFLQEYRTHCARRMERAMVTLGTPIDESDGAG